MYKYCFIFKKTICFCVSRDTGFSFTHILYNYNYMEINGLSTKNGIKSSPIRSLSGHSHMKYDNVKKGTVPFKTGRITLTEIH